MVDAVETDPFGKVDAIDVLDLASLEARAPRSGEAGSKYDLYGSKTGITAVNCADRREHAGTSKR